jgi:hypothetical protein
LVHGKRDSETQLIAPLHPLWIEQCAAADHYLRPRFGVKTALDYLVGEKFINFLESLNQYPDRRTDLPKFANEIQRRFKRHELREFLDESLSRRGGPHRQRALLREARDMLLPSKPN